MERTVTALKARNISVGEGVKSTTYVRVKTESDYHEGKGPQIPSYYCVKFQSQHPMTRQAADNVDQ